MSLVFTFLGTTNQTKTLIFNGAFDFHKNLVKENEIGIDKLDKAKIFFIFIENKKNNKFVRLIQLIKCINILKFYKKS